MIADKGTRRCSSLKEVDKDSEWINGYSWMRGDEAEFPMLSAENIALQCPAEDEVFVSGKAVKEHIRERYGYSNYVLVPNHKIFSSHRL